MEERMATLNIKTVPDSLYRKLLARAKKQRRSVSQEVIHILAEAVETPTPLSILTLRGLGKQVWRDVDAAAHVARERHSWE
jgi:hypothetical protein